MSHVLGTSHACHAFLQESVTKCVSLQLWLRNEAQRALTFFFLFVCNFCYIKRFEVKIMLILHILGKTAW